MRKPNQKVLLSTIATTTTLMYAINYEYQAMSHFQREIEIATAERKRLILNSKMVVQLILAELSEEKHCTISHHLADRRTRVHWNYSRLSVALDSRKGMSHGCNTLLLGVRIRACNYIRSKCRKIVDGNLRRTCHPVSSIVYSSLQDIRL